MTDTPIIRAARALAKADSGEDCYDALDEAMQEKLQESAAAVMKALREPSEGILKAMMNSLPVDGWEWEYLDDEAPDHWRAMIDAALAEK